MREIDIEAAKYAALWREPWMNDKTDHEERLLALLRGLFGRQVEPPHTKPTESKVNKTKPGQTWLAAVNKILYLNLDRRTDRRQHTEAELDRIGIPADKRERFVAIEHKMGCYGATLSHIAMLRLAQARGYGLVLLMEDDIEISVPVEEFHRRLDAFVARHGADFDVCMLTAMVQSTQPHATDSDIEHVRESSNAGAYLVSARFLPVLAACLQESAEPLLRTYDTGKFALDQYWKRLQKRTDVKWYVLRPQVAQQKRMPPYDTVLHDKWDRPTGHAPPGVAAANTTVDAPTPTPWVDGAPIHHDPPKAINATDTPVEAKNMLGPKIPEGQMAAKNMIGPKIPEGQMAAKNTIGPKIPEGQMAAWDMIDRRLSDAESDAVVFDQLLPKHAPRLADLGRYVRLNYQSPTDRVGGNTTILRYGRDQYLAVVRQINWIDGRCTDPQGRLFNDNLVLVLDAEFAVVRQSRLIDATTRVKKPTGWLGFEDLRLYEAIDGAFRFTCSNFENDGGLHPQIARGRAVYNASDNVWRVVWVQHWPRIATMEKNWLPVVRHPDRLTAVDEHPLHVIYHWHPELHVLAVAADGAHRTHLKQSTETLVGWRLHEGSCVPLWDDVRAAWIAVVHVSADRPSNPQNNPFYHRLVLLQADTYKPIAQSPLFVLRQHGVEYACGSCWSVDDRSLVLSFGEGDAVGAVCVLSRTVIDRWLQPVNAMTSNQNVVAIDSQNGPAARWLMGLSMPVVDVWPLPYAIPACKIVATPTAVKSRVLADVVSGVHTSNETYRFGAGEEHLYYARYGESLFATTGPKGGWDCLRHYEIIAAGCMPIFTHLAWCPALTMVSYPKTLITRAAAELLPWRESHRPLYDKYLAELLDYARANLTCDALARYFLSKLPPLARPVGQQPWRVLMLTADPTGDYFDVNYSREFLAFGLRSILGANFVDVPKLDALYDTFQGKVRGHGYTWAGLLKDDPSIDRSRMEERILKREFDVIVYAKVGLDDSGPRMPPFWQQVSSASGLRMPPFWQQVSSAYPKERIAFVFGGDAMQTLGNGASPHTQFLLAHRRFGTCFVRELAR